MDLIFQNSKQLKEVRQFIKGVHYVYDCIAKKEKKVYMYISNRYIGLINDFTEPILNDYKVSLCVLRKHMFRLQAPQIEEDNFGFLYRIDADLILKFLNSHIEPEISQVLMSIPAPNSGSNTMKISYDTCDGVEAMVKTFVQYQDIKWPFTDGKIPETLIANCSSKNLLTFPPKFAKSIDYSKKYPDIWLCLGSDGVNIKKTEGEHVVKDHFIKKELFCDYNFIDSNEFLRTNTNLCVRTGPLLHHLELSNRQNRKTLAKICLVHELYDDEQFVKKCFIIMETFGEKKEMYEMFEISARKSIEFQGLVEEPPKIKPRVMISRETKKEENDDERTILNKFYGKNYEEQLVRDLGIKQGIISQSEPKGEEIDEQTYTRKQKIEID